MLLRTEIKVVLENFFSLIVLKGGNYIFPLIYLPYVVKTVGIYNFGLISFAEAIVLFFKAFTDYGFDFTGTRSIANNKLDTDFINRKVSLILSAKFVLVFLSFFVFIIL